MPRAIAYGRRDPAAKHYEALVADQPGSSSSDLLQNFRARAGELASQAAPEAVRPFYLARLAEAPNAFDSPDRANLWEMAAEDAIAHRPLPSDAAAVAKTLESPPGPSGDGALEKIAKYVPAESITITTLAFAALTPTGMDVWLLVAGGAIANMLYLYGTALQARKKTKEMPRWYFYPLSGLALVLWAIAVIEVVGSEVGIGGTNAEAQTAFALAFAAFLIPLIDIIATGLTEMREEKKASSAG